MTKITILSLLSMLIYVLQATVLPQLLLYRLRLDLLLAWVVAYALLTGPKRGLKFGFLIGLTLDLLQGYPFGLHILTKSLLGYLAGLFHRKFFREQLKMPLLIIGASLLIQEAIQAVVYWWGFSASFVYSPGVNSEVILLLIYYLIFAAWIYRLLASLLKWLDKSAT